MWLIWITALTDVHLLAHMLQGLSVETWKAGAARPGSPRMCGQEHSGYNLSRTLNSMHSLRCSE